MPDSLPSDDSSSPDSSGTDSSPSSPSPSTEAPPAESSPSSSSSESPEASSPSSEVDETDALLRELITQLQTETEAPEPADVVTEVPVTCGLSPESPCHVEAASDGYWTPVVLGLVGLLILSAARLVTSLR